MFSDPSENQNIELTQIEKCIFNIIKEICKYLRNQEQKLKDLEGSEKDMSFVFVAGGWVRDKLLRQVSYDIDLIVPFRTLDYLTSNMEKLLKEVCKRENRKLAFEKTDRKSPSPKIKDKPIKSISIKIQDQKPPATTSGSLLSKESFQIPFEYIETKIDIRELGEHETSISDTETRDFTMNSIYYDIQKSKIVDHKKVNYHQLT